MELVNFVLMTVVECVGLIIYIVGCEIRARRERKAREAMERRLVAIERALFE